MLSISRVHLGRASGVEPFEPVVVSIMASGSLSLALFVLLLDEGEGDEVGFDGLLMLVGVTSSINGFVNIDESDADDHPAGTRTVRSSNGPLDLRLGVPISSEEVSACPCQFRKRVNERTDLGLTLVRFSLPHAQERFLFTK